MSIGAVGGIGGPGGVSDDYSWYTPGSAGAVSEPEGFDAALDDVSDVADSADDLAASGISSMPEIPETSPPLLSSVEETGQFSRERMGQDSSNARASLEDFQMAAVGFHTRRQIELLGL